MGRGIGDFTPFTRREAELRRGCRGRLAPASAEENRPEEHRPASAEEMHPATAMDGGRDNDGCGGAGDGAERGGGARGAGDRDQGDAGGGGSSVSTRRSRGRRPGPPSTCTPPPGRTGRSWPRSSWATASAWWAPAAGIAAAGSGEKFSVVPPSAGEGREGASAPVLSGGAGGGSPRH